MESVVRFEDAGVSLGGRPVLRGIDLLVQPGESVGVTGPNGSGKTTLIRTAATLIAIDHGELEVIGRRLEPRDLLAVRRSIGLIGHQPSLLPELTLFENLDHVARLAGIETTRVARALDVVGLTDAADRRAEACSFGMKRRVEIAHVLLTKPMLLLLDEAASGLDASARDLIDTVVHSVCERGGGCLVVSHDRSQLGELTTRVLTLAGGRLVPAT